MATETVTITEAREQKTADALKWIGLGVVILLVCAFMIYFLGLWLDGANLKMMRAGMIVGAVAGGTVLVSGLVRFSQAQNMVGVAYPCPYCEKDNQLVAPPTSNFECEHCNQTVRFDEAGKPVPIRVINCSNCNTDNKVSIKSNRFICIKCNATIQVQAEQPTYGMGPVRPTAPARPAMLLNTGQYDVLITNFDRAREGHLAATVQNLLGVEASEARRLLDTITDRTPLIVGVEMAQLDAEHLQAQLSQLGAKITLRSH